MKIIFGLNSFLLSSQTPSELGIQSSETPILIERRQRYFHLFFIPFFPCGKFWTIKKENDSNKYEVSPEMKAHLNALGVKHTTPWYSYSLVLLALLVGLLIYISNKHTEQVYLEEYREKYAYNNSIIEKALPNTYFSFYNDDYSTLTLKILSSDAKNVKGVISRKNSLENEIYERYINNFSADTIRGEKLLLDTLLIPRTTLLSCYNLEEGTQTPISFGKYKNLMLTSVHCVDVPVFTVIHSEWKDGFYQALLLNRNVDATVLKIIPWKEFINMNSITWNDSLLPQKVNSGGLMFIKGRAVFNANYGGTIIVQSNNNHIDSLDISVSDGNPPSITPKMRYHY